MEKFVIQGGVPLSGTIVAAGNKNGALPILAACLLTDDEVILRNVPRISDVEAMTLLLEGLGARVQWLGPGEVSIDASCVDRHEVDRGLSERIRASFLLAGPLLARFGEAVMPPPGGDVIGRRRLDPHLDAFRALGATVENRPDTIRVQAPTGLRPCDFLMDEPSVMATENALMAAALTRGPTVIRNAASEPHVQDLARMLVAMGAPIDGIGSNVMTVHGVSSLRGCTHTIAPDHIEIGSFMALAGVTGGELIVQDTVPEDLRMIRLVFERLGLRSEVRGADVIVPANQELVIRNDQGDYMPKVEDGPWPAFPRGPDEHRARAGHAGGGLGDHPREDVREPPLLHRQAAADGCGDHDLRSASRDRGGTAAVAWPAGGFSGHPGGDGDADRGAVRGRDHRDRKRPPYRPRLRADRRTAARPRRADHAGR